MSGDLHCHTKLSDGSMGIEELILLSAKQNIETIAITDRDCIAGAVRGKLIGERHGVTVIPGVEISASDEENDCRVNILCYLSDTPDRLEGLCRRNSLARKKASYYMIMKAVAAKYPISHDLVSRCAMGSTNTFKVHIMHALMETGYTSSIYGDLYDELFDENSEKKILVAPKYASCSEVIDSIHEAGGIAVLAHPGMYPEQTLSDLIEKGLDGIEVWHPFHTPEQSQDYLALAKEYKLLSTGGSGFRGLYNSRTVTVGSYVTPKQQLSELLSYKSRMKRQQKLAQAK